MVQQIKKVYLGSGGIDLVLLFDRELASVWHTDLSQVRDIVRRRYDPLRIRFVCFAPCS